MTKNIYLFCAESGSGKTSIVNELEKRYSLKSIQSYTTRPRRYPNETGHIFVTDSEFDTLKDMVAFTNFSGARYCATAQQVEESDLYVVDPAGINYFKENYKGEKQIKVIHIFCPEDQRVVRMAIRGDVNQQIKQRLENDKIEFKDVLFLADITIINDSFNECVEEVYNYICEQEGKVIDG